jgi:hypothetical protein
LLLVALAGVTLAPRLVPGLVRAGSAEQVAAMRPEFAGDVPATGSTTHYAITLTVSADLSQVEGQQRVTFVNQETTALDQVYFQLFPNSPRYGGQLDLRDVRVGGQSVETALETESTALAVPLAPALSPGDAAVIDLAYTVTLPAGAPGYNPFGYHDGVLALANVYPLIPAYDESGWRLAPALDFGDTVFSDVALYDVTITGPAGQVLAASGVCQLAAGPATPVAVADAATATWRCASGPMRDFMAALSEDYVVASRDVDGVRVSAYSLSADAAAGEQAAEIAAEAVRVFQELVGPYPYRELDVVEAATTIGGMEYPGLVVIDPSHYASGADLEFITVHEIAHQWWYGLVGSDPYHAAWIDEGLTQYMTVLYARAVHGEDAAEDQLAEFSARYAGLQAAGADAPIDRPLEEYARQQYLDVVYGKAPLFFDAVHGAAGDEAFRRFLRDYFSARRYAIAGPAELRAALAEILDAERLDAIYGRWTSAQP